MVTATQQTNMSQEEWPAEGLEHVGQCPVCGSEASEVLHDGLTDPLFSCAPGKWKLNRCFGCGSAYLDPRPTPHTIHLAYQNYFTHQSATKFHTLSLQAKVRRVLANGYRNWRYGTTDRPASRLGVLAALFMPLGRAALDGGMRHLPRPQKAQCLLDVGCGNGEFLLRAKSAGWVVSGIDFDPKAVEAARRNGLEVRQGQIENLEVSGEWFDAITMSHVIEHVHEPMKMLRLCYEMLKPGGFIWIDTPNLEAQGHVLFGANWRGLEPPRHLTIFTLSSMCRALKNSGFRDIASQPYRPLCASLFAASTAIAKGMDPAKSEQSCGLTRREVTAAERSAKLDPNLREFISIKAWKG